MVSAPSSGVLAAFGSTSGGASGANTSTRASPAVSSTPNPTASKGKPTQINSNGYHPPKSQNSLSSMSSAKLDLRSVEIRGSPTASKEPTQRKNRPHGLQEAPTYRPTEEDWKDPFEYICKIRPEAQRYGICKIIPPDSWNPPFAIDTEKFHFRTRKQELNSVEGGTRANLSYLDALAKYHKQQGNNLTRLPYVDKKPLDLYRLKKAVESRGGFDKVCRTKKWAEIGRDLGYSGKIMSSLSTSLKNSYQKWLCPYEDYLRIAKPGVHQQLELEYGGPLTPSPAPSPIKPSNVPTPSSLRGDSPARQASDVLQASLNDHGRDSPKAVDSPVPVSQSSAGGFTAINSGSGFTPVNSGFTSVNRPIAPAEPNGQTPSKQAGTPFSSAKNTPEYRPSSLGPSNLLKRQLSTDSIETKNLNGDKDDGESGSRRSKRLKKESVPTVAGSHMSLFRPSLPRIPRDESLTAEEKCEQCGKGRVDGNFYLACESCDHGYHGSCLDPPVTVKPETEWNCPRCLVGDGQFGFEEGGLYSLKQFQEKAADFKQGYFENKMPLDPTLNCHRPVTEDDVEQEFWRLVADLEETVEVEYGADIHCTTHGSGFPTAEKNPDDPYASDPWNLNVLPYHEKSLFRHIKTDISGMTVPWVYVGMIFSTFCWHNEDHYSYSANYQHFGATKTWYGIPGEDAEKFENAMREAVPELFETQPDLLFQLVTLLPPEQLQKAGVRVYALDQRAGQLVITFPQAYHAGFNHGFNFNEAVNFAPCDWEPFGLLGIERLQQFRRQPCFSHDELLWTAAEGITGGGLTIETAKWLAPALERIHRREVAHREEFLSKHLESKHACMFNGAADAAVECSLTFENNVEVPEAPEEEYSCSFCKAFTYLSWFRCLKTDKVLCLQHAGTHACCDLPEPARIFGKDHILCYRQADDVMTTVLRKVTDKAQLPEVWQDKYEKTLDDEDKPSLKTLRALLAEGEKIPYDLPSLPMLRGFVDRCNHWVEEATNYTVRKQQNRRKDKAGHGNARKSIGSQEQKERDLRNVSNIRRLLDEAEQIGFECPEVLQLQERAEAIKTFQESAERALALRSSQTIETIEELLDEGQTFNVDLPEMETLNRFLDQLKWNSKARENRGIIMTLDDVEALIEEGKRLSIPPYNDHFSFYNEQLQVGQQWERKAQELIQADNINYSQLQALSDQAEAHTLPVSPTTLASVKQILHKYSEAHRQVMDLLERAAKPDFSERPKYSEVVDLMKKLEEVQAKPTGTVDLEKQQRRHEDWMRKGKKLFGKTNAPLHILKSHMDYVLDHNLDCFDTTRDRPRLPGEPQSREPSTEGETAKSNQFDDSRFRDVFCLCRRIEAGLMIECELCHEWYHSKCLKVARGKYKEEDKYTCPICDWRVKIPRDAARPKLEELQQWYDEIRDLPFQPDEEEVLSKIIDNAQDFRNFVASFCNPVMSTASEAETQRFYLRKIEGAEILLAFETNFFRQELHKWHPVAPTAPPVLDSSKSTRKQRPTKLQKLLAQHGVENPDDLPEPHKSVAYALQRKAQNAELAARVAAAQSEATAPSIHPYGSTPTNGSFLSHPPSDSTVPPVLSAGGSSGYPHTSRLSGSASSSSPGLLNPSAADMDIGPGLLAPKWNMQVVADLVQANPNDDAKLSIEERIRNAVDPDLFMDAIKTAHTGYGDPQKADAHAIDTSTEFGRRRAEILYGPNAWQLRGSYRLPDPQFVSRTTAAPASPSKHDPIGIGVDQEGDGDDTMFELINHDEDDDGPVTKDLTADSLEHERNDMEMLLDGE